MKSANAFNDIDRCYGKVPWAVMRDPRLTPAEFRVLIYLASYTDVIHPSRAAIVAGTGMSEETVDRALRSMAKTSVIGVFRAQGSSNWYVINPHEDWQLDDRTARVQRGAKAKERAEINRAKYDEYLAKRAPE